MTPCSTAFEQLREFLSARMRMSHLYQPLMLKLLIERGGWVSTREIASAFLARDESQVDYYAEITKGMPGKVLASHGLVKREKDGFRLVPDPQTMTSGEHSELARICDDTIARYGEKRGRLIFSHRRTALGEISGPVRYEVLRRAASSWISLRTLRHIGGRTCD